MVTSLNSLQDSTLTGPGGLPRPRILPTGEIFRKPEKDVVSLGQTGSITSGQALNIVAERAYEKLRGVVDAARAELGLAPDEPLDTSPEATANRIADFALNFFGKYAANNGLADDEAGRAQFVEFIGAAISKGIDEARGILTALNALSPDIGANIDKTASIIQSRLDDFVKNGLQRPSVS